MRVLITLIVLYFLILLGLAFARIVIMPFPDPMSDSLTRIYEICPSVELYEREVLDVIEYTNFDLETMMAIMCRESAGNKYAKNGDAIGLMQILKGNIHNEGCRTEEELFTPSINIECAVKHLKVCDYYFDDIDIISCYHGGLYKKNWKSSTTKFTRLVDWLLETEEDR